MLQVKWHDDIHPHWHLLPILIPGLQLCQGGFLIMCQNTFIQVKIVMPFSPFPKLLKFHGISFWGWMCGSIHQLQVVHNLTYHVIWNGTYTTSQTHSSWQLNLWWYHEQKNLKTLQGNIHAILLGLIFSQTKAHWYVLETCNQNYPRLFY